MTKSRLRSIIKEVVENVGDVKTIATDFSSEMRDFLFDDAIAHNVMIDDSLTLEIEAARARIAKAALTIAFDEVKRFRQRYNGAV
jgi:isochorismate hydrolase